MQPDLKYQKAIYILIRRIYFDTLALAEIKVKVQTFLLENLRPVNGNAQSGDVLAKKRSSVGARMAIAARTVNF